METKSMVIRSRNNEILLKVAIRDLFRTAINKAAGFGDEISLEPGSSFSNIIFDGDIREMSEFTEHAETIKNEITNCYHDLVKYFAEVENNFDANKKKHIDLKKNNIKKISLIKNNDEEEDIKKTKDEDDNSSGSAKISNNINSNGKNLF